MQRGFLLVRSVFLFANIAYGLGAIMVSVQAAWTGMSVQVGDGLMAMSEKVLSRSCYKMLRFKVRVQQTKANRPG